MAAKWIEENSRRIDIMEKIGKICFWLGFIIEAVLVMIDKSAYINPYESYLFRFKFILFFIKIDTTKYIKKEWI